MAYNIFTIIAGYYTISKDEDGSLVLLSALAAIVQAVTQTIFILDAGRRNTYSLDQQTRKPGREVVTFLLVSISCELKGYATFSKFHSTLIDG